MCEINITLFPEFLDNMNHIERILSQPGGCALLVGCSGVGRRTSTSIISHMLRMQFISPNIQKNYSQINFRNELKEILRMAGIEGENVTLISP